MVTMTTVCLLQFGLILVITAVSSGHFVTWQTMLRDHPDWKGHYGWYGVNYSCTLHVNSVQGGIYGVAWATFEDGEAVIEMTVSSFNETLVLKLDSMHKQSSKFPSLTDIVINTRAKVTGDHWVIAGNFVEPEHRGFSNFFLVNVQSKAEKKRHSSMTLGLAVGIPVSLFVIITIIAILLFVWAVRKGYLRHVPSSFERFRNPPDRIQSDFNTPNGVNISLQNQTGATVHM